MSRPRKNNVYVFQPCGMDRVMPEHYSATAGQRVRVIALPGCPRPGTMGQYHIEDATSGNFLGMVSGGSLVKEDR